MLVGGIVIEDGINQLSDGRDGLYPIEGGYLLVAMARHALADHCAVENTVRGKQCGRAMPQIIVGHRPGPALLHRQARLGAVERLNL